MPGTFSQHYWTAVRADRWSSWKTTLQSAAYLQVSLYQVEHNIYGQQGPRASYASTAVDNHWTRVLSLVSKLNVLQNQTKVKTVRIFMDILHASSVTQLISILLLSRVVMHLCVWKQRRLGIPGKVPICLFHQASRILFSTGVVDRGSLSCAPTTLPY